VPYEISEFLPGAPLGQLLAPHVPQLLALNALQRDAVPAGPEPFVDHLVRGLTEGFDGYCELGRLQAHDPALLDRLQAIANSSRDLDVAERDVVHSDFSSYNIMFDGDEVSGVFDWQGVRTGDATFDLITLAFYMYDAELQTTVVDAARARTPRCRCTSRT
jgi:hypothetical protein